VPVCPLALRATAQAAEPCDATAQINASDGSTRVEIASLYNLKTSTFRPYHITLNPFCNAHALLPDGRGILVGGEQQTSQPCMAI
jgi:hypothetical protein